MEKPSVYLETSFISYLTARPSHNLIVAAHQSITVDWWENRCNDFELFVSQVVFDEAKLGNSEAAAKRLNIVNDLSFLEISEEVINFADKLIEYKAVPKKEIRDAYHLSVACIHGINYLLTWNCKHIANAEKLVDIEQICIDYGYQVPVICTPEQLLGD